MESARNRVTMEVVDAEDLWLLPAVDKYGYICRGCDLTVYPASYLKTNLQRPIFEAPTARSTWRAVISKVMRKPLRVEKRALCGASYRQVPPCHRHGWSLGMSDRLSIPLLSPRHQGHHDLYGRAPQETERLALRGADPRKALGVSVAPSSIFHTTGIFRWRYQGLRPPPTSKCSKSFEGKALRIYLHKKSSMASSVGAGLKLMMTIF